MIKKKNPPKGINVLSLFDGISCGQQALKELGVKVNKYYASEIDVNAIKITHKNFPDTIKLGYVEDVKAKFLPKIDLILAGSPCQGFSFNGKQLNFEDPRSKLFWEFVRVLKECKKINPDIKFLLENVRMKKEYEKVITKAVGVEPMFINSKVLSAQSRGRLYWCNWEIDQVKDADICVDDILETPAYKGETGFSKVDTNRIINYNKVLTILDTTKKHPCVMAQSMLHNHFPGIPTGFKTYRDITITELEALQTLPRNYTKGISEKDRVHGIGNGWTISVIKHILKPIK
jgi:site-specific DNA-cytosine methylase